MKKEIILITAMLLLILAISQAQSLCDPELITASKDTVIILNDSKLLLIERPTNELYEVTMTFKKKVMVPVVTIVNDTELQYIGTWNPSVGATWSVTYSSEVGATAFLNFYGNRVEVVADKASNHGKMGVKINNGVEKIVDLYSPTRINGVTVVDELVPMGTNSIQLRVISNTVLIDFIRIHK